MSARWPSSRLIWASAAALALALAVRLAVIAVTPHLALAADPADYARHALSIAAGHGYPASQVAPGGGPTALRPPGFPVFLGAVYALTGDSLLAGRVAQALVGTALVALVGVVGLLAFGPRTALAASGLAAVYPPLVLAGASLLSEPLFTVLELGAVAAVLVHGRVPKARWVVAAGVLAGLAVLTRSNGAVLLVPLAAGVWGRPGRSWRALGRPALLVACALLAIVPWTVRNAVVLHAFVPVSDQSGFTLSGTYNATSRDDPRFPGAWRPPTLDPAMAGVLQRSRGVGEPELDRRLRAAGLDFARAHPSYVPAVAARNLLRLVDLGGPGFHRLATASEIGLGASWSDLAVVGFLCLAVLAVGGALTPAARRAPPWLWAIPLLAALAVAPIEATQRFRVPIDPFVVLLAAVALTSALRWRRRAVPALR